MLKIRLSRGGRKKRPFYSIIVAESSSPRDGKFVDKIGYYDPFLKEKGSKIDFEKFNYWLKNGAQLTDRVQTIYKNLSK